MVQELPDAPTPKEIPAALLVALKEHCPGGAVLLILDGDEVQLCVTRGMPVAELWGLMSATAARIGAGMGLQLEWMQRRKSGILAPPAGGMPPLRGPRG